MEIAQIEKLIGTKFNKKDLLKQAFVHRSYLNEHKELKMDHNERLEFLGDAVLELVTTVYLFKKYPSKPEGDLTAYRASLVNTNNLSLQATMLGMNEFLLLSRGEAKDVGRARQYILANTYEAVVGAIYLDKGYDEARAFIERTILLKAEETIKRGIGEDYKSLLQKKSQEETGITPTYKLLAESGPDHNKFFTIGLFIGEEKIATGDGNSKQEAEQEAARKGIIKKGWIAN